MMRFYNEGIKSMAKFIDRFFQIGIPLAHRIVFCHRTIGYPIASGFDIVLQMMNMLFYGLMQSVQIHLVFFQSILELISGRLILQLIQPVFHDPNLILIKGNTAQP